MKLDQVLSKYTVFKLAKEKDSSRLNRFFSSSNMDAKNLELTYLRGPNFFSFLKFHGDENLVFYAENNKNEILLVCTIAIREGYINGNIERIAYLSDMRINIKLNSARLLVNWKRCMGEILENSSDIEEINTKYMYTAILQENSKAMAALVNNPRNPFVYKLISNYSMINILKMYSRYKGNLQVSRATNSNINEVFEFINQDQSKKQFGFTKQFLKRSLMNWDGLQIEDFILVRKNEDIIAACCFWNPSPTKKIIISKLPRSLKILKKLLSKILLIPSENEEFKVQYLNFLTILKGENEALEAILSFAKTEKIFDKFHAISFASFEIENVYINKKKFIYNRTALSLFQTIGKSNYSDVLDYSKAPALEISLV